MRNNVNRSLTPARTRRPTGGRIQLSGLLPTPATAIKSSCFWVIEWKLFQPCVSEPAAPRRLVISYQPATAFVSGRLPTIRAVSQVRDFDLDRNIMVV